MRWWRLWRKGYEGEWRDGKKGMKNKSGMIAFDKDEWMIRFANGMGSFAIGMTKMGWIPI